MAESQTADAALTAARSAELIESSTRALQAAATWSRCEQLGVDTEFVRERTYKAKLGLVQISDGRNVWLLDPLADGILQPLGELLRDRHIAKIFHSPSEDLEVLQQAVGQLPEPLIDTQLACALLGQPLQMGYHKAVEWLLGIQIAKDHTRSNWRARPLRQKQLRYAALDVAPLPLMWQLLERRLRKARRLGWFREDCERQLRKARSDIADGEIWQRIRGAGRLDGVSLAVLQALARWREEQARARDLPRGFVLPDPVLARIAAARIQQKEHLAAVEGLHPKAFQRDSDAVCDLVRRVVESGRSLRPLTPLSGAQRRRVSELRRLVKQRSAELGVEPGLLATKNELEALVRGEAVPERLTGWRTDVITSRLLDMLAAK